MIMTRLGIDTGEYFEADDFRDVTNFNTQDTMNALGFATKRYCRNGTFGNLQNSDGIEPSKSHN